MNNLIRRMLIDPARGGVWLAGLLVSTASAATTVSISEELDRLMTAHGFEVRGIEQTAEMEGRAEGADLVLRLRVLLDEFDHVIVQDLDGGVERVIILGEKVAVVAPPMDPDSDILSEDEMDGGEDELGDSILLKTQRQGTSHSVTLTLEGPNGRRVRKALLIDTGSEHIVLPASLIAPLGISPSNLRRQTVQTANGTVDARLGTLDRVHLDDINRVEGISAAFIEDSRLGGNALLGMSLLGRFLVTIDDEQNQVTLDAP
jgi:aspartyl protease family protein